MSYISKRFNFDKSPNPLALKLNEIKKKGNPYIDLTVSNPTITGLIYPENEIKASLTKNEIFKYNPSPKGMVGARQAIARYYEDRGRKVNPARIYLSAGTSESISYLMKLFCERNDEILVPAPGYPLYDFIGVVEDVVLKKYHIDEIKKDKRNIHYSINFDSLKKEITNKTRAIVIVQPNNPLGYNLSQEEINQLIKIARECKLILIIDEVFADFTLQNNYIHIASEDVPVIILNGFSKILALPQFKLSWIYMEGTKEFLDKAGEALEIITDTFLTVNTSVMVATDSLLSLRGPIQNQIKYRLVNNLEYLDSVINDGISFRKPDGGWYVVLNINKNISDEDFSLRLLTEKFVYVHPGYMFDFDSGCNIVLSLLTPNEVLVEGVRRINELVSSL